jgi:hypothetical protein
MAGPDLPRWRPLHATLELGWQLNASQIATEGAQSGFASDLKMKMRMGLPFL